MLCFSFHSGTLNIYWTFMNVMHVLSVPLFWNLSLDHLTHMIWICKAKAMNDCRSRCQNRSVVSCSWSNPFWRLEHVFASFAGSKNFWITHNCVPCVQQFALLGKENFKMVLVAILRIYKCSFALLLSSEPLLMVLLVAVDPDLIAHIRRLQESWVEFAGWGPACQFVHKIRFIRVGE